MILAEIHDSLCSEHGVDEVEGHSNVVKDMSPHGVDTGGQTGAGKASILHMAGDVVTLTLT